MTADSVRIFIRAEDRLAATKLGNETSIPCRYAANWRLAGRFSLELDSLLIVILKLTLYAVIVLNVATLIITR